MSSPQDGKRSEGVSIWLFVGAFVVLATIGLVLVLIVGSPSDDSRPGRTASGGAQTTAQPSDQTTTSTTAPASTTTPVTMPDGSPAPEGVKEVTLVDGVLRIRFSTDSAELGSSPYSIVPSIQVESDPESAAIRLSIACSRTTREQLSELTIAQDVESVTIGGVVLVPINATGCNPNAVPQVFDLELQAPLGGRTMNVLSPDTRLPQPSQTQPDPTQPGS